MKCLFDFLQSIIHAKPGLHKFTASLLLLLFWIGPLTVQSQNTGSARFANELQYIEVSGGSSLDITDDFTIEAWIFLEELPPSDEVSTILDNVSVGGGGLKWVITSDGKLELSYPYLTVFTNTFRSNASIPVGQWVHIALTWDYNFPPADDFGKMYINGVLDTQQSFLNGISSSSARMCIGGLPDGLISTPEAGLRGRMGELKIWNTTRSEAEVEADRFVACILPSSLRLYYNFITLDGNDIRNLANPGTFSGIRNGVNAIFSSTLQEVATPSVLYVDANVGQSGGGTTWGTACKTLDEALVAAHGYCTDITNIHIAQGIYKPSRSLFDANSEINTGDLRDRAFHIRRSGLHLKGGYPSGGSNTSNPSLYPSILSGDFNGDDGISGSGTTLVLSGNAENAYHVLVSNGDDTFVEGLTIEGGNANGGSVLNTNGQTIHREHGGGAYHITRLLNSTLRHNSSTGDGAGLYNTRRLSSLEMVSFSHNLANGRGAGLFYNNGSNDVSPIVLNTVTWTGNKSNSAGGGAYLGSVQAPLSINQGLFKNNAAQQGAGLFVSAGSGNYLLEKCVFDGNSSSTGNGGGMASSQTTLEVRNSVFVGNTAGQGGGLWLFDGQHTILNSTLYGNTATLNGSGIYNTGNANSVANSIIWGNIGSQGLFNTTGSTLQVTFSVTQDALYPGAGNIIADPKFMAPHVPAGSDGIWRTNDDGLRLDCQSPAYNTAQANNAISIDIRGGSRPQFGQADIGAYESERDLIPTTIVLSGETTAPNYLQHSAAGGVAFQWSGGDTPNQATNVFRSSGTYKVTVTNSAGCTNVDSVAVTILPCPGSTIYVDGSVGASGNGTSWVTAFKTLDEALVAAWRCTTVERIEVARGTYVPSRFPFRPNGLYISIDGHHHDRMFHLPPNVTLLGGYPNQGGSRNVGANPTILQGNGSGRVLLAISANNTTLDGFTIQQGRALSGAAGLMVGTVSIPRHDGGGLYSLNSSLVVNNCTFKNNRATFGAGLYSLGGTPLYQHCTFRQNIAEDNGGGTYVEGDNTRFANSVWHGNQANASNHAGGIQALGQPTLIHCTLTGNSPFNLLGSPNVRNSIIYSADGIGNNLPSDRISSSIVTGAASSNSNGSYAALNPVFVDPNNPVGPDGIDRTADDGLSLQENSPAINIASANDATPLDIIGTARVVPDIGAYEALNACTFSTPKTIFVKHNANGTNDGSSWANAYLSLNTALQQACNGDQIWVASGVYKPETYPAYCEDCTDTRAFAFALKNGVKVYGGFVGTENNLAARNIAANVTTLSGDIGIPNDATDNCYHVVVSLNDASETLLDGFTIKDGNANGTRIQMDTIPNSELNQITPTEISKQSRVESINVSHGDGGGLYWHTSFAVVHNCIINNNKARFDGGGWSIQRGVVTSDNNTFLGNIASVGGGIYANEAYLGLEKTKLLANSTIGDTIAPPPCPFPDPSFCGTPGPSTITLRGAGGIRLRLGNGHFSNSFFVDNIGAGVDISDTRTSIGFTNCVFHNNSFGGLQSANSSPVLLNCTVAKNKLHFGGFPTNDFIPRAFIGNSIIWTYEGESGLDFGSSDFRYEVRNSIWQGAGGALNSNPSATYTNSNNLEIDPIYTNFANLAGPDNVFGTADDGLIPSANGLALDLGDTTLSAFFYGTLTAPTHDVIGIMRTGKPDAGAYEAFVRCPPGRTPLRHYVNHLASGSNDGTSWGNAFTSVSSALEQSCTGDEIWVAQGTYKPTFDRFGNPSPGNPREKTFSIRIEGIQLYGGFVGNETQREQRNWKNNPTILSGDIGVAGNNSDNAYHVVYIDPRLDSITTATILDGFSIQHGNANGTTDAQKNGGGIYNSADATRSSPTIANCIITQNFATQDGGGIYNSARSGGVSSPLIRNCTIVDNTASNSGGGISNTAEGAGTSSPILNNCSFLNNSNSYLGGGMFNSARNAGLTNPVLTNCVFFGNQGSLTGAGMSNEYANPVLINCTFYRNHSRSASGGLYNQGGTPSLINCIVWGNTNAIGDIYPNIANAQSSPTIAYSIIQGSGGSGNWDGNFGQNNGNNLDEDPLFVDPNTANGVDNEPRTSDDGLRLTANSPARNAGNASVNVPLDILGNARGAQYDMGAYEIFCADTLYVDASIASSGNGQSWATAFKTLESALSAACAPQIILVAAGTYKPTRAPGGGNDPRDLSFEINRGIQIFGGYPNGGGNRDIAVHQTILSGDFNDDDQVTGCGASLSISGNSENAYHVVVLAFDDFSSSPLPYARLDGLHIRGGHANGTGETYFGLYPRYHGGGVLAYSSHATLSKVVIEGNTALSWGGGLHSYASPLELIDCVVQNNMAHNGGGIGHYWQASNVQAHNFKIKGSTVACNRATEFGGALHSESGHRLDIDQSVFEYNHSSAHTGGVSVFSATNLLGSIVSNSVFYANTAVTDGGGARLTGEGGHTVVNTVFAQNTVNGEFAFGAGLRITENTSSAVGNKIINCTFFDNDNQNYYGGGLSVSGPNLYIVNTVFDQNTGGGSNGFAPDVHNFNNATNIQISHSALQFGDAGQYGSGTFNQMTIGSGMLYGQSDLFLNTNLLKGADNRFRTNDDGLNLKANAPVINAGLASANTRPLDIADRPRINNDTIDMGAYEYQGAVTPTECPNFSGAPAAVRITNSVCNAVCTLTDGTIMAPTGTPCPSGSTLQYRVNNGAWSTSLPVYDQDGPAQTIKTRCSCDSDSTIVSDSTQVVTQPGVCDPPVLTCPSNISVNNDAGQCSAVVTYTAPVGSDNCPGATTTQIAGLASGAAFPVGTTTNTFVVTAANGQKDTCSFTVTVTDAEAPTITCPTNISVNNDAGQCSAVVSYVAPIGSDNCSGATTVQTAGLASGAAFPVGTTTNTFVVTAANGQKDTCSFTVTVVDAELPTITCPANVSVNNDAGQCSAVVTYTSPVGSDNCPGATTTQIAGLASGAAFPVGTSTNTFVVTAANGQKDTCSFTVTVTDAEAPTITCPANVSVNNDAGQCSAVVTYTAPVGSDNCPGTTTVQIAGLASGAAFPVGTTTNTFVVTAANGQTDTCSFTVTVVDAEAPTITCPANMSVNNDAGQCSAVVTYTAPVGSDNCPSTTTVQIAGLASGAAFPVGTTTNTFVVTAANGQKDTCSFTVTVTDAEAPTITCPANVSVNNDAGQCSAVVTYTTPAGSDNCPGATTVQTAGLASGAAFPVGTTTNTFVVTAANGQKDTCSFTVTVVDAEAPTITCPANMSVNNDAGQCSAVVTYTTPVGSDNCAGVTTIQTAGLASGAAFPVGTTTNTFVVTAANGQKDTCSFTVTVVDDEAPIASCQAPFAITLNDQGQYTLTVEDVDNGSSDNCGLVEYSLSKTNFTCADIGKKQITLRVKDAAGLIDSCTVEVTVQGSSACEISIGNAGGPSIEDPCTCSTEPGYFDEEVVITSSTNNETWVLVSNTGLIDPNTDLPYPVNTPFVSIGNNQYSLVGRHKSGEGYAIRAASSFYPDTLSIDNVCYYPEVVINGLPALVSPSAAPFVVTGTAANNAAGTGAFTLNGVAQAGAGPAPTLLTINPGTLPLGTNTLSYTFDAGAAGSKNPNDPGCVTTIQRSFQVAHCACQDVTVSLDINCQFVLTGNLVSDANCNGGTVRVMDNNPSNGNIIDCAGVWTYGLFDAFGNVICWGKVTAEDKRAPELVCAPADVTLDCYDVSYVLNNHLTIGNYGALPSPRPAANDPAKRTIANAEGVAGVGDNCQLGLIPPALVNDNIKNLGYAYFRDNCRDCGCRINLKWSDRVVYYSCTDTAFVRSGYYAKIERQWVATDCNGMSSSYVQDIFFKRPALTDFVFNAVDADTTDKYDRVVEYNTCTPDKSLIKKEDVTPFDCSWFDSEVNPRCLYIDQIECNYSVTTKDTEFPICGGKGLKIDREMYIFDWCAGGIVDTLHILIKIGDFEAPKLEYAHHAPYDISTGPMDCTATIPVTAAGIKAQFGVTIKDNCTLGNIGVSVKTKDRYVKGILVAENVWEKVDYAVMNGMMIGLPVGTHRLIVDASDGCYNAKKDSFEFKVLDKIAPVMKCDDDLHVSLSNANGYTNGYAQVSAADIDEGSWDNCKMAWIAVRRNVPASCEASFVQKGYDSNGNGRLDAAPFDHPKDAPANFDWNTVDGVDLNGDGDIRDFGEFVATKGGKKMTPLLDFVEFFCCDLTERVTVELWGADTADDPKTLADETNYNYCWMDLLIEDKVAPTCIAPWDVTIDCDDKNIALIDDKVASSKLWGDVTITTGNDCAALDTVYSVEKSLKCGYGKIVRKWTLSKQTAKGPITITCSQTIWVRPIHQYNIRFPKDATTDCKTPSPDTVIVDELACDLLAVNVSDKRYDATGDECYKIFRTYTVINWCAYDDKCGDPMAEGNVFVVDRGLFQNNGAAPIYVLVRDDDRDLNEEFYLSTNLTANEPLASNGRSGDYHVFGDNDRNGGDSGNGYRSTDYATYAAGLPVSNPAKVNTMPRCDAYDLSTDHFQDWEYYHSFMYTQIIKVYDDTRPVVTGVRDTFCTSPTACTANIVKVVNLKDNCSDKVTLENQYLMIAPFQTTDAGKMILYSAPRWSIRDLGNGNYEISVTNLPEGTHDLIVVGRDECGNLSLATRIPFTVKDCKAPAPICINGLSTGIMPDGNGGGMMAVWATDFVASKIYDCNGQGPETKDGLKLITKYSINRVGQAVNKDQTGLNFTCADINNSPILVELHAWDEAGNHDFCITFVELIDSRNVCAGSVALSIAGTIATEGNAKLQGAGITLSGSASQSAISTANGGYSFLNLSRGGDFTVTPQLDKNHLNGVSTFDLVLIQKHILGIQALNSPYKMIAADVNNSKSISTLDLIALRKLILNIDTHFANNTSWRFVDAAYQFPQATNPWSAAFPEVVSVNDIANNVTANFIAIKVGDVNASATVNTAAAAEVRTFGTLNINAAEANLKAGQELSVEFSAEDLKNVQGYQFALNLDKIKVELVDIVYGVAKAENFGLFQNEGIVTTSWNQAGVATATAKQGALFTLVLRAKADAPLSTALSLNRVVAPEAYNQNNEYLGIKLNFEGEQFADSYELKQNTPNPFNGETSIGFTLPKAAKATLTIRDVKGALIYKVEGNYVKGNNQVILKKEQLGASGVLYYTLETTDFTATKKMVKLE